MLYFMMQSRNAQRAKNAMWLFETSNGVERTLTNSSSASNDREIVWIENPEREKFFQAILDRLYIDYNASTSKQEKTIFDDIFR